MWLADLVLAQRLGWQRPLPLPCRNDGSNCREPEHVRRSPFLGHRQQGWPASVVRAPIR
ncbi:hypothetical protein RPG13_00590 [Mesorhizobium sp. ISC15]